VTARAVTPNLLLPRPKCRPVPFETEATYCGDNLKHFPKIPDESIDLIYIGPRRPGLVLFNPSKPGERGQP